MASDYKFQLRDPLIGGQMLFVAFGALVLVPILTGLNPSVALFTAGIGTLIFQIVTRGQVPVFLASSFAFIAPITYGVKTWGIAGTMSGLAAAGLLYVLLSILVKIKGVGLMKRLFPPVVTGSVIMVIGFSLADVAINMSTGAFSANIDKTSALIMSGTTLTVAICVAVFLKGMLRLLPIAIAIVVGYTLAAIMGYVEFGGVLGAAWFAIPDFTFPEFNWNAILFLVPVAIAPAIEHFGDIVTIGTVAKRDYLEKPGIDNTLLGDGIATSAAACLGGPPNTTYSEVTGAVALTKQTNPAIMTWAALFAIGFAFCGKLEALLKTIPTPVMGGVMILLFGLIASVGARSLVDGKTDFSKTRNLIIFGVAMAMSIGLLVLSQGKFQYAIVMTAGITVLLNLILPEEKEE